MQEKENSWDKEELVVLEKLKTPEKIQLYIDSFQYNPYHSFRSPRYVLRERKAHCSEGAIFAAATLSHLGYPPLILDLKAENDDDHIIAIYQMNSHYGALAMSNFATLRLREPVYRDIRELVMSYFEVYFNTERKKTLREYSETLNLNEFDHLHWRTTEQDLEIIGDHLDKMPHHKILTPEMISSLSDVSERLFKISLIGVNQEGLYDPKKEVKNK